MNCPFAKLGALLGVWLLFGLTHCGASGPDDSVKDNAFCDTYLKRCPDEKSAHDECALFCTDGVKAASNRELTSVCWQTYCDTELGRCKKPAGFFTTDPDAKACAMAHGWWVE